MKQVPFHRYESMPEPNTSVSVPRISEEEALLLTAGKYVVSEIHLIEPGVTYSVREYRSEGGETAIVGGDFTTWREDCLEDAGDTEAPRHTVAADETQGWMPDQKVYKSFLVDTNCVNSRKRMPAMNQLETWAEKEVITLLTAETAQTEMLAGNDAARRAKAYTFIFTMSEMTTAEERAFFSRIATILFPDGVKNSNQQNDVEIVFNSSKYMRPLITNDGGSRSQPRGILGSRTELAALGISVLTPEEAVEQIRAAIEFRDKSARQMAQLTGRPVPAWVGQD